MVRDLLPIGVRHTLGHGNGMHIRKTVKIVNITSEENNFCVPKTLLSIIFFLLVPNHTA